MDAHSAIAEAAEAIYREAKEHKRLSSSHRNQARALMEQYSRLKAMCDRLGIKLIIESGGGERHGRKTS